MHGFNEARHVVKAPASNDIDKRYECEKDVGNFQF